MFKTQLLFTRTHTLLKYSEPQSVTHNARTFVNPTHVQLMDVVQAGNVCAGEERFIKTSVYQLYMRCRSEIEHPQRAEDRLHHESDRSHAGEMGCHIGLLVKLGFSLFPVVEEELKAHKSLRLFSEHLCCLLLAVYSKLLS